MSNIQDTGLDIRTPEDLFLTAGGLLCDPELGQVCTQNFASVLTKSSFKSV